jgi:DNA-binding XRE family transcriptional regulator
MGQHLRMMHVASHIVKCQLHHGVHYVEPMQTPAERLKAAREAAGYPNAKDAALAMGASVATYIQHENGTRNFPTDRAQRYARFFRTTPEWLLYGREVGDRTTGSALGPQLNSGGCGGGGLARAG